MSKISKEAFEYLNMLRKDPKLGIPKLQELLKYFKGKSFYKPGEIVLLTNEGDLAVKECIEFLNNQKGVGELKWSKGLESAARDHVKDIGSKGLIGHNGSDGSSMSDRIERYGEWDKSICENISFGQKTGEDVIIQLIIDDGVSSRGHRKNCFKSEIGFVGIYDGQHKQYKNVCVMDFAGEYQENNQIENEDKDNIQKQQQKDSDSNIQSKQQKSTLKDQLKYSSTNISIEAFEYLNQVRQDPKRAISQIKELITYFKGFVLYKPGEIPLQTNEGPQALQELIQYLEQQQPQPLLTFERGLEQACIDHINDIGPKGICGHEGSKGQTLINRIQKYGQFNGLVGENISFGQKTGQDVILQLLIDDGVSSRGHRQNCFNSQFTMVGIASGNHSQYETLCVLDFAKDFKPYGAEKEQKHLEKLGPAEENEITYYPPQSISTHTEKKISILNGYTIIQITKTYSFKDGSTNTAIQTVTDD
ncbi:unnamed protein product [Paramecium sonneborni]|uniref:SCP domain-containing protein n=1 Tax=Paramecium sonneborni TaxID=65129 RepID=A0A8S1RGV3_9CILI|nr:unnamed protein product [Paramecium sonneborni]